MRDLPFRSFFSQPMALLALIITLLSNRLAMSEELYEARVYQNDQGEKLNYRLLTPAGYSPTDQTKYPLVLFLHGAGERGDDNKKTLVHATGDFAKADNRAKHPCFVLVPQCPDEKKWVEVDWTKDSHVIPAEESISLKLTRDVMASLQKEFRIDDRRLYVTGLSMGGYGTWDMIARTPKVFAAAAPVCGGADEATADRVTKLPIWAFHGDQDKAVIPERSRRMIAAVEKAGGKPKYTEYPGVGHDSWTQTYADPKFMEWLFTQQRP